MRILEVEKNNKIDFVKNTNDVQSKFYRFFVQIVMKKSGQPR